MIMKKFLLALSFSVILCGLRAQNYEFGVYAGLSIYEGDLGPSTIGKYFQTLHPAYGLFARANVVENLSFRLSYANLTLSGDDAISNRSRDLNFRNNVHEITLQGEWNVIRYYPFSNKSFYIMPFGYLGLTFFRMNPEGDFNGEYIPLQPLGTEGQGLRGRPEKYNLWNWAVPVGGGLKLFLSERWILGLEVGGRYTFTDYLDDVSNTRVVYQDVLEGNGPIAAQMSRPSFDPSSDDPTAPFVRGGPANDFYITGGVTISYVFGHSFYGGDIRSIKCPMFDIE